MRVSGPTKGEWGVFFWSGTSYQNFDGEREICLPFWMSRLTDGPRGECKPKRRRGRTCRNSDLIGLFVREDRGYAKSTKGVEGG